MIRITLAGDITLSETEQAIGLVKSRLGPGIEVTLDTKGAIPFAAVAGLSTFALASAIASVASAIMHLENRREKATKWSSSRLKEVLENEMLAMDVMDFEIKSMYNGGALIDRKRTPCRIILEDTKKGEFYKIYVYRDGKAYRVKVSRDEVIA
jgi:hypothetical protein